MKPPGDSGRTAAEPLAAFDCLWCGRSYRPAAPDDLEAWARLCPDCIGRAGENPFLRSRLRSGLAARAAARQPSRGPAAPPALAPAAAPAAAHAAVAPPASLAASPAHPDELDEEQRRYYAARAPEYDDWYLRRGRYARGAVHQVVWQAELDAASRWLDDLPFRGQIVELAAGTGWWSPLLASKGTLWLYDASPEPLELARQRLLAHGLSAHLHLRDAWQEPDRPVDGLFAGFWLSHVARARLDEFLRLVGRWLEPGGLFAFIDSRFDPQSGAVDHSWLDDEVQLRRLDDGRTFRVRKILYEPAELEAALEAAGFRDVSVTSSGRFFLLGSARR